MGNDSAGITRRAAGLSALALAGAAVAPSLQAGDAGPGTAAQVRALLPELEQYVRKGMGDWHVPGAAVGVVAGDEVLLAAGYGVRDAKAALPVDARTMFQIGSLTKAFCAATEAMMVDQGRLAWSDRVIDHDPDFRLFDPWVTREFRIRDLLAQRSGLAPHVLDLMWVFGFPPDAVVAALRHVPPVDSFRDAFAYQNILQIVAGRIVARRAGAADWSEALRRLLLEPLGMAETNTSVAALKAAANHARGHVWFGGRLWQPPFIPSFENVGPAGAINSTLHDMLAWLRLQIGRGSIDGKRVVSEAELVQTWRPLVDIQEGLDRQRAFPGRWSAYASGWIFHLTPGGAVIWHNGGTGLFRSHLGFVPDRRVGIVILTNEGSNDLVDSAGMWFYDRVLGNPMTEDGAGRLAAARERERKALASRLRPAAATPPAALEDYVGAYESDTLGDASVTADSAALTLAFAKAGSAWLLRPWNGEVFTLAPADSSYAENFATGEPEFVLFERAPSGQAMQIRFQGADELTLRRKG